MIWERRFAVTNAKNEKNNNNLRTLYVKEILFNRTDEENFLTVNDLAEILENEYGITASRKTLYIDVDMLIEAGYDIECVILQGIDVDARPRSDNSKLYYIIDVINKSIKTEQQIAFKYYEYQTTSKKVLKNGGKIYTVSPYQLVCCNDYYYLLAYSDKHEKVTAFRVDRIYGIPEIKNVKCVPKPDYHSFKKYMRESFHMKSGEEATVILSFDNSVIDALIDRFGQDLDITFIRKNDCIAKVNVQLNNVFFAWLFGFDGKVKISGPEPIKEQYIRMVSREMARL